MADSQVTKFLRDLTNPEAFGWAVSEEVRAIAVKLLARLSFGRPEVFGAIEDERDYQDSKHGPITSGGGHSLGEWLIIMEDELAEARRALIKGGSGRDSLRSEIVQVIATGVACLEQHGLEDPHRGRQI